MTDTDMLSTIVPKSDQKNFDDFLSGQSLTIKITNVSLTKGDQPVTLHYAGDNGKPYKPCLSMRRVIIHCWGPDAKEYVGRSMTLYGDPKVRFGGAEVGGIRISNMSHITEPKTMALTTTRANRKPFTVRPLEAPPAADPSAPDPLLDGMRRRGGEAAAKGMAHLQEWWSKLDPKYQKAMAAEKEEWKKVAKEFDEKASAAS